MTYTPQQIIDLTNQYRTAQGLSPVQVNPALMKAAQQRAQDMATTQNFSHHIATTTPGMDKPWGFVKQAGYDYLNAGENLALNFNTAPDTLAGWRASPTHNANLVNPKYSDIGVAIVPGTYRGKPTNYVVQFFGTPRQGAAPAPQPHPAYVPAPAPAPAVPHVTLPPPPMGAMSQTTPMRI